MTITSFLLPVTHNHQLKIHYAGNPLGLPIMQLHGGPGAGCDVKNFANFDLRRCFVILHDQRGCGESLPFGKLQHNTTWDLVEDIDAIRRHFNLPTILLYGGSWGSTLALAYGEKYPQHVLGFVLRSICLGEQSEYDWLYQSGAPSLFPEAFSKFTHWLPTPKPHIVKSYYQALTSTNQNTIKKAALHWHNWALTCLELPPIESWPENITEQNMLINLARLESHYFSHEVFLKPNQLINELHRICHLKAIIIHGAKDFLCPPINAYRLHQAWPSSLLKILPAAGHLSSSEGMQTALLEAVNYFCQI